MRRRTSVLPDLPRRAAFPPESVQKGKLLEGVHWLPETLMLKGSHFTLGGDSSQWLLFQHNLRLCLQVVEDRSATHHVATINVARLGLRLLIEPMHRRTVHQAQLAETTGGMNRSDGADFSGTTMKVDRSRDIDAAHSIAIGQKKNIIVAEVLPYLVNAVAGERIFTSISEGDLPIFFVVPGMEFCLGVLAQVKGSVAGIPEVVPEVFLDHFPFVTKAEDKLLEA